MSFQFEKHCLQTGVQVELHSQRLQPMTRFPRSLSLDVALEAAIEA
jgi:hypothetical protein